MAKTKTYNSAHTYTLKDIKYTTTTSSGTTTNTMEDVVDLTAPNAIIGLQRSALSGSNAEFNKIKAEMVNYAYYSLRNQIETAANSGQSYVDIVWEKLIQNSNTSKLETFLGLSKNSSGSGYKKWPGSTIPSKYPWGEILTKINGSGSADLLAVGYLYDPNATVPYAVRLSWRSNSQPDDNPLDDPNFNASNYQTSNVNDSTNKDILNALEEHPYYKIEKNATVLIDDTTAISNTNDASTPTGQIAKLNHFLSVLNQKIESASMSGDNYVYIFWGDFDASMTDAIAKLIINSKNDNHKGDKLYTATDSEIASTSLNSPPQATIKFKENLTLYADNISSASDSWTIEKNTEWTNFLTGLFKSSNTLFNKYAWQWLINNTTKTIDGFVITWHNTLSTAESNALQHRTNYKTNTTPEPPDTNVYLAAMTTTDILGEKSTIYKALHTKHITALVNNIQGGLLAAYNGMDESVGIPWTSIDGGLTAKEMFNQFKKVTNITYSGDLRRIDDSPTASTLLIEKDGDNREGYVGALKHIFGSFVRVAHSNATVTANTKTKDVTISVGSAYVPGGGAASFNSNTMYWDYLYYKNTFATPKTEDGKVNWDSKTNFTQTGSETGSFYKTAPCGIVVQLGSSGDAMKEIIQNYAETPDPTVSYK